MPRRPSFRVTLALLVGLGLGVRLVYALVVMRGLGVGGDGLEFHLLANQLADGHGYIQPLIVAPEHVTTADKPPLYPLLLAVPSLLGWESIAAHRALSCLMGAALVAGVGLLGRRVGGERVGLVAAGLAALYPLLVGLDGAVRSESLYAPLLAFALLAAYRVVDSPTIARAALLGALLGAAALTRSEALLLAVLIAFLLARLVPRPLRLRLAVTTLAVTGVVVAPWGVRNWIEFDRPVLSTNSGSLAYGANCREAYYSRAIGSWACLPPMRIASGRDEADLSDDLRRTGTRYAREHAERLPAVAAVRLLRTFDLWAPASATRFEARIGDRDLGVYRAGVVSWFLLLPLAVAGLLLLRRRGEPVGFLVAPVLLVVAISLLGYGTPRFRVPAEIPAVVLAAVALSAIAARPPARRRPEPVA